jgi:hypothetical protein
MSGIVHVEWVGDVAVLPTETAIALVQRSYARHASDIEVAAWNEKVDEVEAAEKATEKKESKKQASAPAPVPAQPASESAPPPVAAANTAPAATPPVAKEPETLKDANPAELTKEQKAAADAKEELLKRAEAEAASQGK